MIWVAIAFGERPGPWAALGGAIVVGAITARGLWVSARDRLATARMA